MYTDILHQIHPRHNVRELGDFGDFRPNQEAQLLLSCQVLTGARTLTAYSSRLNEFHNCFLFAFLDRELVCHSDKGSAFYLSVLASKNIFGSEGLRTGRLVAA
jgi:hypothetical protein